MSRFVAPLIVGLLCVVLAAAILARGNESPSLAGPTTSSPAPDGLAADAPDTPTTTFAIATTQSTKPDPCTLPNEPSPRSAASLAIEPLPVDDVAIIDVDFDDLEPAGFGDLDRALLSESFAHEFEYLASVNELSLQPNPADPGDLELRQRYVPVERGSPVVEFPTVGLEGSEELWLSYTVHFEPGWEWVLGGKLPGLAGGSNPSGLEGGDGTDGFSARLSFERDEHLAAYVYHPDREGTPGQVFESCRAFAPGTDLEIAQRVVMNSAPNAFDGIIEVWVNGEKQIQVDDIRLRTTGDFNVDVFVYSSFYGGNSEKYAPSKRTHARFDEFLVGRTAESVGFDWSRE